MLVFRWLYFGNLDIGFRNCMIMHTTKFEVQQELLKSLLPLCGKVTHENGLSLRDRGASTCWIIFCNVVPQTQKGLVL